MAIGFIDALTHNATLSGYGLVESDEIQGGIRTSVDNLYELALLRDQGNSLAIGQLKEYSTLVYVKNTDPLVAGSSGDVITQDGVDYGAPSVGNGIGKFYCLKDISKVVSASLSNSELTVTVVAGGDDTAVPAAWVVLDTLVGGGEDGIADFSGVSYNEDANLISELLGGSALTVDGSNLTFQFPTIEDVAAVFDQGTDAHDSPIEIVSVAGETTRRIQLKQDAVLRGSKAFLGPILTTAGAASTILEVGSAIDAAFYSKNTNIYTNLVVFPSPLDATQNFRPSFSVSGQGVNFNVASTTNNDIQTTDETGEVTDQQSVFKANIPAGVLLADQTHALVQTASGLDVFKRALGSAAFQDVDDLVSVETVLPSTHMEPVAGGTNIKVYTTVGGTTDSDGTGEIFLNLNDKIQIGTDSAAASLTVGTQTHFDAAVLASNPLSSLRVYGDTTIDGDLTVAGTLITTTSSEVSFEDTILSLGVARYENGEIVDTIGSTVGDVGIEAFSGHGSSNITNNRPYIHYKANSSAGLYGAWYLANGYEVAAEDGSGNPTSYSSNPIEGKILSTIDVRVTPVDEQADDNDRFLYHDMSDTDALENTLKYVTTPYGLLKKYSQTESFTYTPLGGSSSTYNQEFKRSYSRTSVVNVQYGVADSTSAPRPNGAIRIYHGLNLDDGYVHVIGIVSNVAGNTLGVPVGGVIHPKVKVRSADGSLGISDEYKNSCDVFVSGVSQNDIIKFIVIG